MTTIDSPTIRNQNTPASGLNQDHDGKIAQGVDKATAGAHQRIDDAKNASKPAMDHMADGAHAAVDRMGNMANKTADALDHKTEQLGEATDEFVKATEKYMHEHPVATIGIAVAAGFLLSRILSN